MPIPPALLKDYNELLTNNFDWVFYRRVMETLERVVIVGKVVSGCGGGSTVARSQL